MVIYLSILWHSLCTLSYLQTMTVLFPSFLFPITFTSISCLTALAKISSLMLKRNDNYGYSGVLILFCSWTKRIQHFTLKYKDCCEIFVDNFYRIKAIISIHRLPKIFLIMRVNFGKCFPWFASSEESYVSCSINQCDMFQQLSFEWNPSPFLGRSWYLFTNWLIWFASIFWTDTACNVSFPYCLHWAWPQHFASLIKEIGAIYSLEEIV